MSIQATRPAMGFSGLYRVDTINLKEGDNLTTITDPHQKQVLLEQYINAPFRNHSAEHGPYLAKAPNSTDDLVFREDNNYPNPGDFAVYSINRHNAGNRSASKYILMLFPNLFRFAGKPPKVEPDLSHWLYFINDNLDKIKNATLKATPSGRSTHAYNFKLTERNTRAYTEKFN